MNILTKMDPQSLNLNWDVLYIRKYVGNKNSICMEIKRSQGNIHLHLIFTVLVNCKRKGNNLSYQKSKELL